MKMKKPLIVIGIATIDLHLLVPTFPQEDTKIRVSSFRKTRGGNGGNTLVICSQLGLNGRWIGTCIEPSIDADAKMIVNEFDSYGIDTSLVEYITKGNMPTSYITTTEDTKSRTILHYRGDFPELSLSHIICVLDSLKESYWIHLETRNTDILEEILAHIASSSFDHTISLEVEAQRHVFHHISNCLRFPYLLIFSKDYITKNMGYTLPIEFLDWFESSGFCFSAYVICSWGTDGIYCLEKCTKSIYHIPITEDQDHKIVDTVAAGDVLNAALIYAFNTFGIHQVGLLNRLKFSCRIATLKCQQEGLHFNQETMEMIHRLNLEYLKSDPVES